MKKKLQKAVKADEFTVFAEDINEKNRHTLVNISTAGALLGPPALFAGLLFHGSWGPAETACAAWLLASFFTMFALKRRKDLAARGVLPALYFFISVTFFIFAAAEVRLRAGGSGRMAGAAAVLPFLLLDRPLRVCLFTTAACALSCLPHAALMGPAEASDAAGVLMAVAFSCLVGTRNIREKLADIRSKYDIIAQRDTDPLTGLMTRSAAENLIESHRRHGSGKGVLFIVDIDRFKEVNDTFGHIKGDRILSETAASIKRCFRETDLTARFGGDEFIVFAKETTDIAWIHRQARRLNEAVSREIDIDGRSFRISASIGIASLDGGQSLETLYARADKMLYQAKKGGRGGYRIYE